MAQCPEEKRKALQMRQRIEQEWPLRPETDEATLYLARLGIRLATQYGDKGAMVPWHFVLVRNLAPNAFSVGAGNIFITEGAVTFAENEEEMAAIMAHELGHELAGHFCAVEDTADIGGFFDFLMSEHPTPKRRDTVKLGSLQQSVDVGKEVQADQIAVSILRASGYDPHAMLMVARRLHSDGEGHLFDPRRIQSLERLLHGVPINGFARDSARFQEIRRLVGGWQPGY